MGTGKTLCAAVGIAVVLGCSYEGYCAYVAKKAMEIPRLPLGEATPASVGLDYEDVAFFSRDGLLLKGWYIPGASATTFVVVNGGYQNRVDSVVGTLELARDLNRLGHSILLFDLRGRGESEGEGINLTHNDKDIGGAINYLDSRGVLNQNILLLGFSTGAAACLIFASQNNVAAVISDSSFAEVRELIISQFSIKRGVPLWLAQCLYPGFIFNAKAIYGYKHIDPVAIVNKILSPILFLHGEADPDFPVSYCYQLYNASAKPEDSIWIVPSAGHTLGYKQDPAGYINHISDFLS